jgi:hypothetical protein
VLILHNGVLLLVALNLAVNAAIGLVILVNYPWPVRPITARRSDRGYEKPDLKTKRKGETEHEQSVD